MRSPLEALPAILWLILLPAMGILQQAGAGPDSTRLPAVLTGSPIVTPNYEVKFADPACMNMTLSVGEVAFLSGVNIANQAGFETRLNGLVKRVRASFSEDRRQVRIVSIYQGAGSAAPGKRVSLRIVNDIEIGDDVFVSSYEVEVLEPLDAGWASKGTARLGPFTFTWWTGLPDIPGETMFQYVSEAPSAQVVEGTLDKIKQEDFFTRHPNGQVTSFEMRNMAGKDIRYEFPSGTAMAKYDHQYGRGLWGTWYLSEAVKLDAGRKLRTEFRIRITASGK